jgi:hypothetical protein
MAEATGLPGNGEELQAAFARIEAAVDAGESNLSKLGFWRALRAVKLDPALSEHWADQAGRIDRKAFEDGVKLRFPVWFGNLVLLTGTLLGAAAVVVAMRTSNAMLAGLSLLAAAVAWSVCLHCLAHWMVGMIVGIRFLSYSFGGPFPPRPGLKTDYATYLHAAAGERAWMHASGALATKAAPFIALGFWWGTGAPGWAAWAIVALGVFQILTDVFLSTKTSDWKKVKRERAIARAQLSRRA